MKRDLLRAKVHNGQIRCPRCQALLGKVYYGGSAMGVELWCKSCRKAVIVELRQK